jgi:hypothetical protein
MTAANSPTASAQLDIVFDGTWVIVPSVDANRNIVGVDIYSPSCGHPHGVTFTAQLGPISVADWPQQGAFYMLDDHSHTIGIQRASGLQKGMPISGIDQSINHCLPKARPMGGNWDLMISIDAGPDKWVSSDTVSPQTTDATGNAVKCFSGSDAPTGNISSLQTLSYLGVTGIALCGVPASVLALLPPPGTSGSLIFEGEVPYISTLRHERAAYDALAALAGLDLALDFPLPNRIPPAGSNLPKLHTVATCTSSLIILS